MVVPNIVTMPICYAVFGYVYAVDLGFESVCASNFVHKVGIYIFAHTNSLEPANHSLQYLLLHK